MTLKIYTCSKGHDYASRQDPKSKKMKDRPQCATCGEREQITKGESVNE